MISSKLLQYCIATKQFPITIIRCYCTAPCQSSRCLCHKQIERCALIRRDWHLLAWPAIGCLVLEGDVARSAQNFTTYTVPRMREPATRISNAVRGLAGSQIGTRISPAVVSELEVEKRERVLTPLIMTYPRLHLFRCHPN